VKRIVVRNPGGHGALELVHEGDPVPGPGEARVAVRACGINYADCMVRQGLYKAAEGLYPMTPGFEFSGVVDALGSGATRVKHGQKVFGYTRFGGYASSIVVPERQLFPCPDGWSFSECAGFPAVYFTAYHALHRVAKVERGETILVHSAAGGVGTALIQLGKIAGCRVVGVVGSAHKVELCKSLGADAIVDRSLHKDFWREVELVAPNGFDAIFDANGVRSLREGFKRLAHGGRLVVYGFAEMLPRGKDTAGWLGLALNWLRVPRFSPLDMTTSNRAVMGFNVVFLFHKLDLADRAMFDLLRWVQEGRIAKTPVSEFPFEKPGEAHRALESGRTTGKLVLTL